MARSSTDPAESPRLIQIRHTITVAFLVVATHPASALGAGGVGVRDTLDAADGFAAVANAEVVAYPAVVAEPAVVADPAVDPVEELRSRGLTMPVDGVAPEELRDDFDAPRSGGRRHRAIDILAPRGTPVRAVEDGTILRLDATNRGGGIVVQQADPSGAFVYAYAHLDRWAEWVREGMEVFRGQVLGYVGATGNATTPHLHFTITARDPSTHRARGPRLNPFHVLR